MEQSEFRHQVVAALGPELKGAAEDIGVFMEDHPEIRDVEALIDAFRKHTNEFGHFDFDTHNPDQATRPSESGRMTVVVAGEIMREVTDKLRAVMQEGHGTLAA